MSFSRSLKRVTIWFVVVYFLRFAFTSSAPIFSILSSSRMTCSFSKISTLSIIELISFLLLTCISVSIFSSFNISDARAMHSASALIEGSPIISASHWTNCLVRPALIGSSLKTGPIWYLLNGNFMLGFSLKIRANWNVNSYLKPRLLPPLSFNLNLSATASSSASPVSGSGRISSSNSIIGVSTGRKPYNL